MRTEAEVVAELEAARERLSEIKDKASELVEPTLNAYTEVLAGWFPTYAKRLVVDEASVTEKLGAEGVAELKAEVDDLSARADSLVQETLGDPKLWWHRDECRSSYRRYDSGRTYSGSKTTWRSQYSPEAGHGPLHKGLRQLMGALGAVMAARGYLKRELRWTRGSTFEAPGQVEIDTAPVDDVLRRYAAIHVDGLRTEDEVQRLEEELQTVRASDAWDSA